MNYQQHIFKSIANDTFYKSLLNLIYISDKLYDDVFKRNKALKVAIAIGKDADRDILAKFTTDRNLVLEANNPTDLKYFIKWTSTLVSYNTQHATQSRDGEIKAANISMPQPPTMLPFDAEEF